MEQRPPRRLILVGAIGGREGRGMALGVMVGALTIGSALPHLVNAIGGIDWKVTLIVVSLLTLSGGLIAERWCTDGPYSVAAADFDPAQLRAIMANRDFRLASAGYFGHMSESVRCCGPCHALVGLRCSRGWISHRRALAVVTEVTDPRYVGTALTVQLAAGFILTVFTIFLVPVIRDAHGWGWAFFMLAPGPMLGARAMRALRLGPKVVVEASAEPGTVWISPLLAGC